MTLSETAQLIATLKKENETNTESEREFNNEWIRLLNAACEKAIDKHYSKKTR